MSDRFFRVNRWDALLCAAVVVLAAGLTAGLALAAGGGSARLEILHDGQLVYSGPLAGADTHIDVPGEYPLTVAVRDGRVWVEQSACPGGDCRAQGAISRPGQSIVCLPGRVTIVLRGDTAADLVVG